MFQVINAVLDEVHTIQVNDFTENSCMAKDIRSGSGILWQAFN